MKYGMNLLLWTSSVDETTIPLLEKIKSWGYDGVELPVFDMQRANFERVGKKLKELGLGATAVTVCTGAANPISPDAAIRAAGVTHLKSAIDMCAAAGRWRRSAVLRILPVPSAVIRGPVCLLSEFFRNGTAASYGDGRSEQHEANVGRPLHIEWLRRAPVPPAHRGKRTISNMCGPPTCVFSKTTRGFTSRSNQIKAR